MNPKIKLFNDLLKDKLTGNYIFHLHYDRPVHPKTLKLWIKRGYKPLPTGEAHVRFKDCHKKYKFPAFFEVA